MLGDGTVRMSASGTTIVGTVSNLDIQNAVSLSGAVTATGNVDVSGANGVLTLAGDTLTVANTFATTGSGTLVMTNAADVLDVNDVNFSGNPSSPSAGTMYVTGDFVQGTTGSTTAFAATGAHSTVFNGTGAQTIRFDNPGSSLSRFQDLQVTNTGQVTFFGFSQAHVSGSFTIDGSGSVGLSDNYLTVGGNFNTAGSGTLSMTPGEGAPTLDVAGNVSFAGGGTGTLTSGTLTVGGDFSQSGNAQSFAATSNHITLLARDAGQQTVNFTNPDSLAGSHFANLTIWPSGGGGQQTTFNSVAFATGDVTLNDNGGNGSLDVDGPGELVVGQAVSITCTGGGANVTLAAMRLGGTMTTSGTVVFSPAVAEFFGAGTQTIPMRTDYQSVLITGDAVNFDGVGSATIGGDLTIAGTGLLDLDSASTTVNGDLATQDAGRLRMDVSFFGNLFVDGNATFAGGSTDGLLTNGELKVGGDFTQSGATTTSFAASATHRTRLFGAAAQTVSFASSGSSTSRFGILDVINHTLPVDFSTDAHVLSTLTLVDTSGAQMDAVVAEGAGTVTVDGNITVGATAKLRPARVGVGSGLTVNGTFAPVTAEFFGTSTQNVPSDSGVHFTDVIASGADVEFAGTDIAGTLTVTGTAGFDYNYYTMNIDGDLVISGSGRFDLWDSNVSIGGNLQTQDDGVLSMGGFDSVTVTGNALFAGGNTSGELSGGTLTVSGNFTQTSVNSTQAFAPDSSHTTVLNGTGAQQVSFANPALNDSRFGDLQFDNASLGGLVFDTDVFVYRTFATPIGTENSRNMFGQGNTLRARSIRITLMTVNNMPLVIEYDTGLSPLLSINNTTFESMATTVTQLDITREATVESFFNVTFNTTPTAPGLYMFLHDGAGAGSPQITMMSPSPADPGGLVQTDGSATIIWP